MVTGATIRPLTRKDRKVLAAMIRKLVDKIGDTKLLNLMVTDSEASKNDESAESKTQFSKIGIEIVKLLIDTIEEDVAAWFSDLLGVTVEQFDQMPFDIELQVIDQLFQCEESNRFFTSASLLSKKMQGLAGRFAEQKTK